MATVTVRQSGSADYTSIKTAVEDVARLDGDIINILDEATYTENNIEISNTNLTIQHTASELGRPKIDADGAFRVFNFTTTAKRCTFIGLEISLEGGQDTFFQRGNLFHISGCFLHGGPSLSDVIINNTTGTPSTIKQSTIFFDGTGYTSQDRIQASNGLEIENCLITSSVSDSALLYGYSRAAFPPTASFSTFIKRGGSGSPVILTNWGMVINCIVSGSGNGIQASGSNHSYNLVDVSGDSFRVYDSSTPEVSGTGDIEATPTFVDGTAAGSTPDIAANFALAEGSRGIDEGTAFNSITVDITGTLRPQNGSYDIGAFEFISQDPTWTDGDGTQTYSKRYGADSFIIHKTANSLATRTFAYSTDNRQAPYFLSIPGPTSIRQRSGSYKAET